MVYSKLSLNFLSCLSGSERSLGIRQHQAQFLSCLSGSEHFTKLVEDLTQFLSCLSGSEHDCAWYLVELMDEMKTNPNTINYWVHSQNPVGKKNIESLLENYLDFYNGIRK